MPFLRVRGLEKVLILFTAGIVAVIALAVARTSIHSVEKLSDEQALARVRLAATSADRVVVRMGDQALATARQLAERPTLLRLTWAHDFAGLTQFLERFRETSEVSGCALLQHDAVIAASGLSLPWAEIVAKQGANPGPFLVPVSHGDSLALGAFAPVSGLPETIVMVALRLDAAFTEEVEAEAGLPVAVLARAGVSGAAAGERADLRRRAIDWEDLQVAFVASSDAYVAVSPLRAVTGEIAGAVEAVLPRSDVMASVAALRRSLVIVATVIAVLGALASALIARRLVGPLERLTQATARIGQGDLATPIPRFAGREVGALATTLEDMRGKLLRASADLRRRQEEADAILTGIADGVFAVDAQRRIRYLNPQAATLLGVTPDAAIGRFCGDVLQPVAENGVRPCEEKCPILHARFRARATATEHLLTRGGGRRTVVITSAGPSSPETDVDGTSDEARQFQVIRDETGVESARRMRDAILANVSHEFRTPLAAQLASIELLREQLPNLEIDQVRDLLFSIERGTLRLTQLIDNLLESVRIDAGQDSIRKQRVALDEVLEEAADMAAPLLALREQELEIDMPTPTPWVSGDRARLAQVFVNLLANANKFSPEASTIRVGGKTEGGEVAIWVEDEGPGIPLEEADVVFERFRRSTGEEPMERGMGLGLWIVRSIVERHGGSVEAAPGKLAGARLIVRLPIDTSEAEVEVRP